MPKISGSKEIKQVLNAQLIGKNLDPIVASNLRTNVGIEFF